jgi:hypothetical protein
MDSLLVEAIAETRALLKELRADPRAADLRIRVELLAQAAAMISLRPADRQDVVRLAKLVLDAREEAVALRDQSRESVANTCSSVQSTP